MAAEVKTPVSLLAATSNLVGAVTAIDDDPDSPGGDWLTASSNNSNSVCATDFGTPTGNPTTGAGLQNFKIYARLTANGTACTYNVYLSESGTRINGGTAIATGSLTSTTGQLITATWDATLLGTADGSAVECEFEVVKSGGAPASRTTGEVDAVEWNVEYTAGATETPVDLGSASGIGTASLSKVFNGVRSLSATGVGTGSLTRVLTANRSMSATAIGTMSWVKDILLAPTGTPGIGSASLSNTFIVEQNLGSASGTGTATLSIIKAYVKSLSASGVGTAAFLGKAIGKILDSATGVGTGSINRDISRDGQPSQADAIGGAGLSFSVTRNVSLGATAVGGASLAQETVAPSTSILGTYTEAPVRPGVFPVTWLAPLPPRFIRRG